ncbi:MAG: TIGR01777 family oxidoreductase, partial [Bacteroidota bacterium]
MNYLITGGTGLIGSRLIPQLIAEGHQVHNLSRRARTSDNSLLKHHVWDGLSIPEGVGSVDVVINLAGAGIADKRWSDAYKKVIYDSRVNATKACTDFINRADQQVKVLVSASGYNYYGTLVDGQVDESSPSGEGFMAEICRDWEGAAENAQCRKVFLRTAVVMDAKDGPLAKMLTPYKFFAGGPTGTGKQGFPWIHLDDMVAAIRFLVATEAVSGPVNMCAPQQVTMRKFSTTLGKVLGRPSCFRLGKGILNIMFGEMSQVLWGGAFVKPGVLQAHGFEWKFPELEPALRD